MCLAIPGNIVSITGDDQLTRMGEVNFGGIVKKISLVYVPEAEIDDYVIVHAGFAISILDPDEANRVFDYLDEMADSAKVKKDT